MKVKFSEKYLKADIADMRKNGYFEKIDKFYKKMPVTSCEQCGVCCTDSPTINYIEYMYIYDYLITNFTSSAIQEIFKNALREYIFSIVDKRQSICACLDKDNRCKIYLRAPLSCKLFGISSKEIYDKNVASDEANNEILKNAFLAEGIVISDEVLNYRIPFCEKVIITKNSYNMSTKSVEDFLFNDLFNIHMRYPRDYHEWSFDRFLIFTFIDAETIGKNRAKAIREYQNGDVSSIDRFIDSIDVNFNFDID